jgi:uncharacterized membrane protein
MPEIIYFFGRFHVLALHLPIGIILAAVALEWIARRRRYAHLASAAPMLWAAAAVTAILTAVLGYMHFAEGAFSGPSANAHRLYGTSVAVVAAAIWLLCAKWPAFYRRIHLAAGLLLVALVTLTGHYGGNLTHGSTYLVEYVPDAVRALVGADARRPPVTDLAMADPQIVAGLYEAGFLSRQVSQSDSRLIVSVYSPGKPLDSGQLAALLSAADGIVALDLRNAGIDDSDLTEFARFTQLTRLRLNGNQVSDQGVEIVARLPTLQYLNLYANEAVTDAALDALAGMPALEELYVWQTGVSADGAARLRAQRPNLVIQAGTAASLDLPTGGGN